MSSPVTYVNFKTAIRHIEMWFGAMWRPCVKAVLSLGKALGQIFHFRHPGILVVVFVGLGVAMVGVGQNAHHLRGVNIGFIVAYLFLVVATLWSIGSYLESPFLSDKNPDEHPWDGLSRRSFVRWRRGGICGIVVLAILALCGTAYFHVDKLSSPERPLEVNATPTPHEQKFNISLQDSVKTDDRISPTPTPTPNGSVTVIRRHQRAHAPHNTTLTPDGNTPGDLRQTIESGRLARGWTLHKRRGLFSIYYIINTDGINRAVAQAMNLGDVPLGQQMSARVGRLWEIMPAPKRSTTAIGEVKNQEATEHVVHWLGENALEWNCEIVINQSATDECPIQVISIGNLSPFDRETINMLDGISVRAANKRYVDALEKMSQ